jgi:hypothetical protein
VSSTGDTHLDILFSDHYLAYETLEEFGAVVAALHDATEDRQLSTAAFLYYVTTHHPQLLTVDFTRGGRERIEALLAGLTLPSVTIRRARGVDLRDTEWPEEPTPPAPERLGGNGSGRSEA